MKQFTTSLMLLVAFLFTSNHLSAQTYHEGNWYSLYQGEFELATTLSSFSGVQQDFTVFAPTNGNLQFDYIYVLWGGVLGGMSKVQNTHIYESADGGANKTEMATVEGTDTKNTMSSEVALSSNINYIQFDRPVGNTNTVKYTNVRLPLAYHILLADNAYGKSTDSLTFEEKPLFQVSEPQTIQLRSFYAAGDITITCQHPDVFRIGSPDNTSAVTWAVGPNACASQNGQDNAMAIGEVLGDIDMYSLTIYFCPQHAIDYTDTIVISDGVSSATIAVAGKGLPIGQSIDWQFTDTQMTVDETIALTATATSGLEVAFTIVGDQTIASINNNQLTAHKAGTITVQASQAGNTDYFAAETISHTINISKATPQITELPTIAPVTYGTTLAEALVLNGGKASVEGTFNITKPTAEELTQVWDAGEYTINITFVPTMADAYNSVEATTTLTITPATQTIKWTPDATSLFVNATLPLNATTSSGLEVTYTITEGQDVVAIEGNNIVAKKAGTATITASQAGNNNYLAAEPVAQTITVDKATPVITELPTIAPVTYGTTLAEALVLNGGKASVEGTFNITKPAADELTQVWDAGQYTINITFTPTLAEAYNAVKATTTLNITQATQTITWALDATSLFVNATLPLNATTSSGLEVTYTITEGQDIVAIEGNNIVAKKAGTATITATQAGNNNYLAAEPVAQTITVDKATPVITELPTIAPVTYGTTLAEALILNGGKASVEGTFNITKPTADELTQVWDAGEHTIHITFVPTMADAYNSVEATTTLTITQATQTINWTLDATSLLVNATLPLNATASSGLEVTYTITEGQDIVAIEGNNIVAKKAGTATITATQAGNNNYLAAEPVAQTITVDKATPVITELPTIAPVTYGTTLAEALILNGGKASVEGTFNITKPTADELTQVWDAGEYTIHITFVPTMADAYNSVEATTTLNITPATQTIDWTIDATTLLVNATLPLNATTSSGLEVTYTITEGQDVVAIEGNNIVAKKAGTATITASQAGNNNYLAAETVAHTITVEKATPVITELPTIAPVTYGTTLAEALVLNGGKASVEGTFTFILPTHEDYLQQVWDAGEYAISIAFYPTQEEAYYSIDTTIVLLIEKAAQTITWALDSTKLFVNDTLILTATSSSDLVVTYEVTGEEGIVAIEDNMLIALQAGTITITATQAGDDNYLTADPVEYILTIEDVPSDITNVHVNGYTKKIIHDGKIYIQHNGVYYDILGNTIK